MAGLGQTLPFGTYAPGLLTRLVLMLSQKTPLGRGKARKMMAACVRRLNGEAMDTQLFGQNVRLHMHNNSSEIKALMKPSRYARAEFDFGARFLPSVGGVFVDIGANAGLFSLGMARFMQSGALIAVEPQPRLFERLTANLEQLNASSLPNGRSVKTHLFNLAIGPDEGTLHLSVPEQLGQASAHHLQDAAQMTVPMKPLQAVLEAAGVEHIDVLKIDVEGFEDKALLPFFETAPAHLWPKAIVIEHCHKDRWVLDCQSALEARGYVLEHADRTNLMLVKTGA